MHALSIVELRIFQKLTKRRTYESKDANIFRQRKLVQNASL